MVVPNRRRMLAAAVSLLPAGLVRPAHAAHRACEATSGAGRRPLVELYTSEGCNSCPPADRWLSTQAARTDLVALAFHVDYWDGLGWVDRFADARNTARQRWLAGFGPSRFVYTPEVALNGREWRSWAVEDALQASARLGAAPVLRLQVAAGARIEAHAFVEGLPSAAQARVVMALWQNGLMSQVRAGENRGATLHHDRVVRACTDPLDPADARTAFTPPADFDPRRSGVAAFVQDMRSGEVLQAVDVSICDAGDAASRAVSALDPSQLGGSVGA